MDFHESIQKGVRNSLVGPDRLFLRLNIWLGFDRKWKKNAWEGRLRGS